MATDSLSDLYKQGKLSKHTLGFWQKQVPGKDIGKLLDREEMLFRMLTVGLLVAFFAMLALIIFPAALDLHLGVELAFALLVPIGIFTPLLSAISLLDTKEKYVWMCAYRAGKVLYKPVDVIVQMSDAPERARYKLVNLAKVLLMAEAECQKYQMPISVSAKVENARREFESSHRALHDFDLVESGWNSYFAKAHAELVQEGKIK